MSLFGIFSSWKVKTGYNEHNDRGAMDSTSKTMTEGSQRNCHHTFTAFGGELSERLEALASGLSGLGWTGCWTSLLTWELPAWVTKGRHFLVPHGKSEKRFLPKAKKGPFNTRKNTAFLLWNILMLKAVFLGSLTNQVLSQEAFSPFVITARIQNTLYKELSAL